MNPGHFSFILSAGEHALCGGICFMRTDQLRHPRTIVLALISIGIVIFASACQGNGGPPVNKAQGTPTANATNQSGARNHGIVIQVPGHYLTPPGQTPGPFYSSSPFYFAMGSQAGGALRTALVQQAPVKMLTSWFNGHRDLSWITRLHSSFIPGLYAQGYALQLVVWSGDPKVQLHTRYGPACGRPYPVSAQFLQDMVPLARTFQGSGPLYVSLFAEFSTYSCVDNHWVGNENYYRTLKDQYRAALSIFHTYAPNSRVSICWGSWIGRYDDPKVLSGRSFITQFSDIMSISDFQSFQAMETDSNVGDVVNMTKILHRWGKVLLAYYWSSPNTFNADVRAMFTDTYMATVMADGLFGFGFMKNDNLANATSTFALVRNAVMRYARS